LEDTEAPPTPTPAGASASTVKMLEKFVHDKRKKPKTAQVMQEQITRIGDIAEKSHSSFESFIKNDDATYVASIMNEMLACGATEGSDEHYIATGLDISHLTKEKYIMSRSFTEL
jgi:ATP-dependent Zn protease